MKKFFLTCIIIAVFAACHKKNDPAPQPTTPTTGSRTEFSLDTLYLYASQTWLWYDALPSYTTFNPRQYAGYGSSDLAALKKELFDLVQYKINPSTGQPYEAPIGVNQGKYSFVEAGNLTTGRLATVSLEGKGNDLGLELAIVNGTEVRVRYVNPSSSAAAAGITRGCRIITMNGTAVSGNSTTLNSALAQSSLPLTAEKPDGSTIDVTLSKSSYVSSPVLKYSVVTSGSKKIGYIAFARFSVLSGAQEQLDKAFAAFADAGVVDLVIDLRYNGGGYVQTAEYFSNLVAPTSANGYVMYSEQFNGLMQSGKATILASIPYSDANKQPVYINGRRATYADVDYSVQKNTHNFSKKGTLQSVKNVAFIVTGSTASASELLINSLKPYVNVQLVGAKTYGKPVGFFGIGIDQYTVYISQFKSANSKGEGDYFDGFTPGILSADDVTRDFGDVNELALSKAVAWIASGAAPSGGRMQVQGKLVNEQSVSILNSRDNEFNGMIREGNSMTLNP
ncbi:Peptidase family S41 [Filimonas lacunae]|uniref:Peptidase family S41 n=1 Tax=Filimonas lacunae TaxID=477680 RepID=A0A173MM48_9BACT|nr:S41 family peptidase [Filimonas lacunae]BAV08712.1 carboxyl-terminal protease [Filimonas lacunae]SIS60426.1 Peptidase family S41 [Filimonas lacunae]